MRRYVKKVLKKKHVRIRMKAGGRDLHPLENHKLYRFQQKLASAMDPLQEPCKLEAFRTKILGPTRREKTSR